MINTTHFVENFRTNKNFNNNQINKTPLNTARLTFSSEDFKSIYTGNDSSSKITQALKATALSFNGEKSAMNGMKMELPADSPYDFNDIGELLRIVSGNEALVKDIAILMKPLKDFKGSHHVRTVKAILQEPDRKPLVEALINKFNNNVSANYTLSGDIVKIIETFNPDSKLQNKVLDMAMAIKGLHCANDIFELLTKANEENIGIMQKVVDKTKDQEIFNWLELKLIADEVIDSPEKEPVLDKLLKYLQPRETSRTYCDLGDILTLLETVEPKNPIHTEMLDFFLESNKGLWGTLIENFINMATVENKELIKQALNDATGNGMEAAKQILATLKKNSFA